MREADVAPKRADEGARARPDKRVRLASRGLAEPDERAGFADRSLLRQYVFFFTSNLGAPITDSNILLTDQDIADIIAFLQLL